MSKHRAPWTEAEITKLKTMFPRGDIRDIAKAVGRSVRACQIKGTQLGLRKDKDAWVIWTRDHGPLPSTWGFGKEPGKYTRGRPSPKKKPIGSEFVTHDGYVIVKVAETGTKNVDWVPKSRHVWEEHHGVTLTDDDVIAFKDGNRLNCNIDNLEHRTKAEHMQANSLHNYPKEIGDCYRAIGAITRIVNNRTNK